MKRILFTCLFLIAATLCLAGCTTAPETMGGKIDLRHDAETAMAEFKRADPSMNEFFNNSYGYAVFPSVGKGAAGVGGAFGQGVLYERGRHVGYCSLSQATVGAQLGGQAYREIIFFEYEEALDHFKTGNFAFSAQASAVAVTAGASADADYDRGVAVFTMAKGGLMFEASIGGQKFDYEPR
jgi:lipid-binding SYLF domain-containing protein